MTIHADHPFAEEGRDQVRRFRARIGGRVSLWTSGDLALPRSRPGHASGWTVSSYLLAAGDPWRLVGVLNDDEDFTEVLTHTGRGTVALLDQRHRHLAEMFAGQHPAPGGAFSHEVFEPSPWGPLLVNAPARLSFEVEAMAPLGWLTQVTGRVVQAHIDPADTDQGLHHYRGQFGGLGSSGVR